MKIHTPVLLHHQVKEIAQWIGSIMHCKTKKKNISGLALSKKKNAKSKPRSLNGTDPDLVSLHKQNKLCLEIKLQIIQRRNAQELERHLCLKKGQG